MSEVTDFLVLEPGLLTTTAPDGAVVPTVTLSVNLGGGEARPVRLEVSEAGVGQLIDVLHRLGGQELIGELRRALGDQLRDSRRFTDARLASDALRIMERESVRLRQESITYLDALDTSMRRAFERDLTSAMAELNPERFGMQIDQDGKVAVPGRQPDKPDEPTPYEELRDYVQALDYLRRVVKQWAFPIPKNAAQARRQFEQSAIGPFRDTLEEAKQWRPAMVVLGPRLLKELEDESRRDIGTWADQSGSSTPLDKIIQDTLIDAFTELRDEQPKYRDNVLKEADKAMAAARSVVDRYTEDAPATTMGRLHPLCRQAFVVQAALEEQGYRPGDHGYVVGIEAAEAAATQQSRASRETSELDKMLGWSALGFGVLAVIPVVGQLALLAAVATSAILAVEHAGDYFATRTAAQGLGHQAPRYRVAQPDALGLILDVLSLTSDAALPIIGKLLGATILRPATRALAAARVATVLKLGAAASDVAGLTLSVNATLVEQELRRVGLLGAEVPADE